jgi:hypothetical protein
MKLVVPALIFIPAFVAGLGFISPYWIIGSAMVAYGKAIMTVSDRSGVDDFRKLETEEFMGREKEIKVVLLRHAVLIAISYGAGFLLSYLR